LKDEKKITTIHTCELIPVDLNCLLWHLEKTLAEAYTAEGKPQTAKEYEEKALRRQAGIEAVCWDHKEQVYTDYNFIAQIPSSVITMAMAYPLFCGMAPANQAGLVLDRMEKDFLHAGGLLTTLIESGQQWDAPNGWAPLQWIGYKAALNYNRPELAKRIAHNWTENVEKVFKRTGRLMEKYNVIDTSLEAGGGEYKNQDGFGWTNGVYAKLRKLLGEPVS